MRTFAAILASLLFAVPAWATVRNAASASYDDVKAQTDICVDGDEVVIPATTATGVAWPSTGLTITKAITLTGAGSDPAGTVTKLRISGGVLLIYQLSGASSAAPMRVRNIYFSGTNYARQSDRYLIKFDVGSALNVRIDHCRFDYGKRTIYSRYRTEGVIDHCYFFNPDIAILVDSRDTTDATALESGAASWLRPLTAGTDDVLCVEDCVFYRNNQVNHANPNQYVYGDYGGRCVLRNNIFDSREFTGGGIVAIDGHGNLHGNTNLAPPVQTGPRGMCMYEIYDNQFLAYNISGRLMSARGGIWIIHDNIIKEIGPSAGVPYVTSWSNEWLQSWPRELRLGIDPNLWLIDRIQKSHVWNNTYQLRAESPITSISQKHPNTANWASVTDAPFDPMVLNTDYFHRAPQSGDFHHPYTELVYPHPRVTADEGGAGDAVLSFSSPSYQVDEDAGTLTVYVSRTGNTVGVVGVDVDSVNGQAIGGTDFTVVDTTLSWGNGIGGTKPVTVTISDDAIYQGNLTFSLTLSAPTGDAMIGSPASTTIEIVEDEEATFADMTPNLAFEAEAGTMSGIFAIAAGKVSQPSQTTTPTDGGRLGYRFTIPDGQAGDYRVRLFVDAPDTSADSFFFNVDGEPTAPLMICDLYPSPTTGVEARVARWRGNGGAVAQFPNKSFNLTAGVHELYIRGREADCLLDSIEIYRAFQSVTHPKRSALSMVYLRTPRTFF